ncbi:MAG: Grx4 family monothiol glutaredoxin [Leptospiraceae bacterium]|nr:Grx4 family monothiol glutaredoxin [Leptospiraceae bacterium]MDW8305529.1 Grx4 family monothiol glutaredoxin [Leptospiraceae bacterium]
MMDLTEVKKQIEQDIRQNRIILYMKGERHMPRCGFSARVVEILEQYGVDFATRDVLKSEALRQAIKEYSNWPTLPQLYVNGEFIGGCDIVTELHESGELKKILGV